MKRLLFALLASFSILSGCAVYARGPVVTYDRYPSYVYYYADGSCWADDAYYASCPWYPGPSYGYYAYSGGYFYYDPRWRWEYRHAPPPRWWHRHHHHDYHHRHPAHPHVRGR